MCGGHEQPALTRLRVDHLPGEARILQRVARLVLQCDALLGDPEACEQARGELSLRGRTAIDKAPGAAGEHDTRLRVAPRQLRYRCHALSRLVERDLAALRRHDGVERAAEADDADRRAARGVPRGKSLLERQDQRIAERRPTRDRNEDEARDRQASANAREARRHQQNAEETKRDQEIGGQREKSKARHVSFAGTSASI